MSTNLHTNLTNGSFPFRCLRGMKNTYIYTKHLAENVVEDYSDRLPLVIYRPGIGKLVNGLSDTIILCSSLFHFSYKTLYPFRLMVAIEIHSLRVLSIFGSTPFLCSSRYQYPWIYHEFTLFPTLIFDYLNIFKPANK